MERLLIVGLDRPELDPLRREIDVPFIAAPSLPQIKLEAGALLVERPGAAGHFLPVTRVIYHGIFDDDFDFITCLALWGGPCLPSAFGMLRCRQRIPCLIDSLRATRFGGSPRSFGDRSATVTVARPSVAKWGNRHCGEGKALVASKFRCEEPTLIEDFIEGQAVRLMLIGEHVWQIHLTGDDWKKSIHPDDAAFMPVDPDLLDDAQRLRSHFGLELTGIDYMIGRDGQKYLMEVNHIPNVDRFSEVRAAYLNFVVEWVRNTPSSAKP